MCPLPTYKFNFKKLNFKNHAYNGAHQIALWRHMAVIIIVRVYYDKYNFKLYEPVQKCKHILFFSFFFYNFTQFYFDSEYTVFSVVICIF